MSGHDINRFENKVTGSNIVVCNRMFKKKNMQCVKLQFSMAPHEMAMDIIASWHYVTT